VGNYSVAKDESIKISVNSEYSIHAAIKSNSLFTMTLYNLDHDILQQQSPMQQHFVRELPQSRQSQKSVLVI
jgi:hypothetical protein